MKLLAHQPSCFEQDQSENQIQFESNHSSEINSLQKIKQRTMDLRLTRQQANPVSIAPTWVGAPSESKAHTCGKGFEFGSGFPLRIPQLST